MTITMEYNGQMAEARECLREGLRIFEQRAGKNSRYYLHYLSKLANTYLTVDHEESVKLQKEALSILSPINEQNSSLYLKTAIELMITRFEEDLYNEVNEGLEKFGFKDAELAIYVIGRLSQVPCDDEPLLW